MYYRGLSTKNLFGACMEFIDILASLLALIILEIILGIDNLIFLAILTEKLPLSQRKSARYWGLAFAWITRLLLLASAVWLAKLTRPLVNWGSLAFSIRDLFLFLGGAFLIWKATEEIHHEVEEDEVLSGKRHAAATFHAVVLQVGLMDII